MDIRGLEQPLNAEERYLYEINVRLNILIEMFSSFLDVYAKQNQVATTSNEVVEEVTVTLDEEEVVSHTVDVVDWSKFTVAQIKEELDMRGIEYNTRATKVELIGLLK